MTKTISHELKTFLVDLIGELPGNAAIWIHDGRTLSREELAAEIEISSAPALAFCADMLSASRDVIKQRVEEELRYERVTVEVPRPATLEWMKGLKVLLWDHEERIAESFTPFLEPEDIEVWEQGESKLPTFDELVYLTQMNGDRILEIRTNDDELVYNGRKAFIEEEKAILSRSM